MQNVTLTVAIPTYNRIEKLLRRVAELLPQMRPEDSILISDNATENFRPESHPVLADRRIKIIVNRVNIGGNANIVRCFERTETSWMWLLADDDAVHPGALDEIRRHIAQFPNASYINFAADEIGQGRSTTCAVSGLKEFIDKNDGFANTLLISNNVFNLEKVRPYLRFAYSVIWTNAPHLAPVLKALEQGGEAVYSDKTVIDWGRPELNASWTVVAAYNLVNLTTVLEASEHVKALRRMIIRGLPKAEFLVMQLAYMQKHYGNDQQIQEFARQILTMYVGASSGISSLRSMLLRIAVRWPRIVVFTGAAMYSLLKRKKLEDVVQKRRFYFYL